MCINDIGVLHDSFSYFSTQYFHVAARLILHLIIDELWPNCSIFYTHDFSCPIHIIIDELQSMIQQLNIL